MSKCPAYDQQPERLEEAQQSQNTRHPQHPQHPQRAQRTCHKGTAWSQYRHLAASHGIATGKDTLRFDHEVRICKQCVFHRPCAEAVRHGIEHSCCTVIQLLRHRGVPALSEICSSRKVSSKDSNTSPKSSDARCTGQGTGGNTMTEHATI